MSLLRQLTTLLSTTTGRVCMVLFLDVLSFSIVIPCLPTLILDITHGDVGQAAFLQGLAGSLDGSIKFFVQPLLGRLSDSVGRKPVLAYSLMGSAISFALYVIHPSIETLFTSHALHGITQCTFLIAMSAIADDQHDPENSENLTHSFGLVGVAVGVAFVLGPIVGGVISQMVGYKIVYAMSTLLFILTLCALSSMMHETLPQERRVPFHIKEAIPFRTAFRMFSQYRGLFTLCVAYFMCSLTIGVYGVWILYVRIRYGWGPAMAGVLLSCNGIVVIVAQGFFLRVLVPKIASEATLSVISYIFHGILFFSVGAATSGSFMLWSVFLFGIPSALGEPSIKSILAHMVPAEQGGALQGMLGSVYTLAQIISPLIYSTMFKWAISPEMADAYPAPCPPAVVSVAGEDAIQETACGGIPGLPFFVQGVVFILAAALMRYGLKRGTRDVNIYEFAGEGNQGGFGGKPMRSVSATFSRGQMEEKSLLGMNGRGTELTSPPPPPPPVSSHFLGGNEQ